MITIQVSNRFEHLWILSQPGFYKCKVYHPHLFLIIIKSTKVETNIQYKLGSYIVFLITTNAFRKSTLF